MSGLGGGVMEYFLRSAGVSQPQDVTDREEGEAGTDSPPPGSEGQGNYWYIDGNGRRQYYNR